MVGIGPWGTLEPQFPPRLAGWVRPHPAVPLTQIDGLVEIGHGLWEGKLEAEIKEDWSDLLDTWKRTPETVQMPEAKRFRTCGPAR